MSRQILIKPIISEKAETISENQGKYTFMVDKKANKIEIKKEVERMYNVNVESVNTLIMPSKTKRRNTRSGINMGRVPGFKKAIVTLSEGDEIDFFADI